MGVTQGQTDCYNSFLLWLVHSVMQAGVTRLVFEEWSLQYKKRLSVLHISKVTGDQITCAEYQHQLLGLGLTSGAVRLYQPASESRSMLCRSEILTHTRPVTRLTITSSLVTTCGEFRNLGLHGLSRIVP